MKNPQCRRVSVGTVSTEGDDFPVGVWLVIGLLMLSILTIACGGGEVLSAEARAGKARYQRSCATCHGLDAEGLPGLGTGLHDNAFVAATSDEDLVAFLKEGRPAGHPLNRTGIHMPPRGGDASLTDEDLRHLVAYLRSLSGPRQ